MTAASVERLGTLIKCETKGIGEWWFLIRGEKKGFLKEKECSEEQHLIVSIFVTFEYTLTYETKIGKHKKKEIYICNKRSMFEYPVKGRRRWEHKHSFDYIQWNQVVYFIRTGTTSNIFLILLQLWSFLLLSNGYN